MSETLAAARSPFLQHGARQPVRWLPWGAAAFEQAQRENKPILLDIGAVWCHWCHVMDRESYEDADTAALINENFVPVKVDRDERPDVDARYQRAVQTLTGQGGWPLTAFLTPDGETYFGGTYFPPTAQYGRPSFRRVLTEVARIWREEPTRALEAVGSIHERLRAYAEAEAQSGPITRALLDQTVEEFAAAFDFRYGGFGRAPKFPNAGGLALLLDHFVTTRLEWSERMVGETLDAMARGGIYDQIGGGFHRYATDARWLIPHFEKMAYDNGPLLEVYARACAVTGSELYHDTVRGIISHYYDVAPDLLARGGFPASQDADFGANDDGDYWTWTRAEIEAVLTPAEASVAVAYFGVEDAASAMHASERHVLYRARIVDDPVVEHEIAARLKRVRDARPQPYVDQTVYSGWSALVASGFLAAARYCAEPGARDPALRTLERIWAEAFDGERGVAHRVGDRAAGEYLEDQAYVAQALLDAFELAQDAQWLSRARELIDLTLKLYQDESGACRDRPRGAAAPVAVLEQPHYPIADAPTPAGNAVLALNLLRLAALLHDEAARQRAEALLAAFAGSAARLSTSAATYVRAIDWLTGPVTTIVVVGRDAPDEEPLLQAALAFYRPRTVVRYFAADRVATAELPPELRAQVTGAAPRAYVCAGRACAPPVQDAEALRELLKTFGDHHAIS